MHHLSLQPHQLLRQLLAEQRHRARQAFRQRDAGTPAQRRQAAHIQLFLGGAIGFAAVPVIVPWKPVAVATFR